MSYKRESKTKGFLPVNGKPSCVQNAQLQQTIAKQLALNKKKYDEILILKPSFNYDLYKINQYQALHKDFGKQLLIRQLDRLLQEANTLDRQLSLIRFHDQETRIDKQELAATGISSYQILKNMWKGGSKTYSGAVEHVEELNNIVGHIRNNIKKITQIQNRALQEGDQYYLHLQQKEVTPMSCSKCKEQQELQKSLTAQIISLREFIDNLDKRDEQYRRQILKKDQSIKQLSKKLLEMQTDSKIKISLLQQKWLLEDHQVKQLKKYKNDIEKNSICNIEQGYQIYFKFEIDNKAISKQTSLPISKLIQMIAAFPPCFNELQYSPIPTELEQKSNQPMIPQLQLPPVQSNPQNQVNTAFTDRPKSISRTQRVISSLHQKKMSKLEQMGCSNKYVRSNHMSTKRNHRTVTCTQFEDTYATEAIAVDSFQNIETQN